MPDADAAWRCPRGCDPCVHFDAALRKDIVDDMLHKYGFDFKEAPVPMIIDSAPIVFTARMMIDPASPVWPRLKPQVARRPAGAHRNRMSGSP